MYVFGYHVGIYREIGIMNAFSVYEKIIHKETRTADISLS